jgi:hypothetical protein
MASKIKVDQIQTGDGTGTIALQNQLSGMTTASLPALGSAQMPTGSVLQVVQDVDTVRTIVASTTFVATSKTQTITPSSTSSKILVFCNYNINDNTASDVTAYTTIYRGSTNIGHSTFGIGKLRATASRVETSHTIMYLDSPASTSEQTYTLYARGTTTDSFEFPGNPGQHNTITLMEIAG